jgi:hypothetical protein
VIAIRSELRYGPIFSLKFSEGEEIPKNIFSSNGVESK